MEKLTLHSPDLTERNIDRLAELFPTVVTEALAADGSPIRAIDFDLLRQELSDHLVDGPQERYQLDWPGKREALFVANAPIAKTLRPMRDESVEFDTTKNIFIEGDNLEALKLLQESYLGKVKLIYIDPPYNTGNDFVYDDDFAASNADYLAKSGQVDELGNHLVANAESNGRFHSDWLNMMYPRLKLARNLLAENGFLFISINDVEMASTRRMCDEIFGEANFVEQFIWESIFRPSNMSRRVRSNAEYVICYARNADRDFDFVERLQDTQGDASLTQANNAERTLRFPANVVRTGLPDGVYAAGRRGDVLVESELRVLGGLIASDFAIRGRFKWKQEYLDDEIAKGVLLQIKGESMIPYYRKIYQQTTLRPTKIIPRDLVGDVLAANAEITRLFGEKVFDYPKPVSLVAFLISMTQTKDDDVILDFFAGSSTTAHAVLAQNAADGGHRRFIMVQLGEPCRPGSEAAKAGYRTLADLSKERIRRAGAALPAEALDRGFRVLRVDSTNMTDVLRTPDSVAQAEMTLYTDSVKENRTGEDLLFQVLLNWGLELTMRIESEIVDERAVHVVEDDALIACFADQVSDKVVQAIAERRPLRAVFRDSGFVKDADRINAEQIFAERSPATDVKTI